MFEWLTGTNDVTRQNKIVTPGQENIINQAGQMGLRGLQGGSSRFDPIAQQAQEQFSQRTVPGIAERFTQSGAQRSSAFGQQLGQAGADLSTNLASMGSQFGLQEQKLFQQLLGLGLTPQFENYIEQGNPGLAGHLGQFLPLLAHGFGSGLSGGLSGGVSDLLKLLGIGGQQPDNQSAGLVKSSFNDQPANRGSNIRSSFGNAPTPSLLRSLSGQGSQNQYNFNSPLNFPSDPGSRLNMLNLLSGRSQ